MTSSHHVNREAGRCPRLAPVAARWRAAVALAVAGAAALVTVTASQAATLADAPVFSRSAILGNVAMALSVEWPTGERAAYPGTNDYTSANTYKGYFDPNKCYRYQYDNTADTRTSPNLNRYFYGAGAATNRTCSGMWSGNFLNWAATQTIDPFRLVMTGGYRVRDETNLTVLQKAFHPATGTLYPNKSLPSAQIAGATPFNVTTFNMRVNGAGFDMLFSVSGNVSTPTTGNMSTTTTEYNPSNALVNATVYRIPIRVKVCDPSAPGGVESNCKQYGSNWKPEGVMQQYSQRLRFAAFGYLNQSGNDRDGAVLRARMKFVGPTYPVPGAPDATNAATEWDPNTGIFRTNPDAADATATNSAYAPATSIVNSGVANYLNKFGQLFPANGYKGNDPVGELYYAAQRYFRNLGAVPEWNTLRTTTTVDKALDGFPVIQTWDDPIQYSCQKNFIIGIGDIYTHADKHVPGNTNNASESVALPAAVAADTAVNAVTATNLIGVIEGLGATFGTQTNISGGCCSDNSPDMAGLAYWANVNDIRPDATGVPKTLGKQTIQTLWVDVLEKPFVANNQFYLTAKYGGFIPPANLTPPYSFANTTALPDAWWWTSGEYVTGTVKRPDNYFTAGNPDQMINGLTQAFRRINSLSSAFTTSFSTSLPQVALIGTASFGAQYDASNWTGEVVGSEISFTVDGTPTITERWRATTKLATQLAGTGWDTARRVATWNGTSGVPFRHASLTSAQQTSLDTSYRPLVNDGPDYLNYLRGDRTHETDSTVAGSSRAYRAREKLLGDIVGSAARPVGPPSLPLIEDFNTGYEAFKTAYRNRPTVVYVGANDGMVHAFNGALTGATAGQEMFAYVPSPTFAGPSSPSTPEVDGLAALGNPNYEHHYLVNGTPTNHDVDFTKTWNGSAIGTGTPNWHSLLIGGLGKGGRSYYALDVTDPAAMTSEAAVASKVLWEFTAPQMGFTFGEPVVVKTRKYGWTVIFPSGYNNADGHGYLFFVNPRTGALLEPPVATGTGGTPSAPGLAHINAYVLNYKDGYADAVYGGDLDGNLWRFDITATSGAYPAPVKFAQLTDSLGNPQPVTSRPVIEWHPRTKGRYVMVGTGRLLDATDRSSSREQSFYAIKDGDAVRFNRAADLPAGITFPIQRAQLVPNNSLLVEINPTATAPMGWYKDLGLGANNVAWRIVNDPAPFSATVAFSPTLPTVDDPCTPSGESRTYAVDFASGISRLSDVSGTVLPYVSPGAGVVTDLRFLSVNGKVRLIAGTDTGSVRQIRGDFGSALGLRRLNWRELGIGN